MGVRLVVWAPSSQPSRSHIPTLDCDSLYAASLLRGKGVQDFSITAPSSFLHSRVPCLEESTSGVILAQDIEAVKRYASKYGKTDESLLEAEEAEESSQHTASTSLIWARKKALEQYIVSTLHPLVYHFLFSQELYPKHTAKAYHSGLSFLNRGSLITRLREAVRHQCAVVAMAKEGEQDGRLAAILADTNSAAHLREEEERERQTFADRGGIARDGRGRIGTSRSFGLRGDGLLQTEKTAAAQAFGQMRLKELFEEIFGTLSESLGTASFFFEADKPSLVDLRLFSLLAPLLLPSSSYPHLATSSIPSLLRERYPNLTTYTDRIRSLVWPIEIQPMLETSTRPRDDVNRRFMVNTPGWPSWSGRQETVPALSPPESIAIRLASALGSACGRTYHYASTRLSPRNDNTGKLREEKVEPSSAGQKANASQAHRTEAEKKDARQVTIGRWIWISSAVIGLIGTAFASGLLAIEFVDAEEGEDEEDETDNELEVVEAAETGEVDGTRADGVEDDDNVTEIDEDELQEMYDDEDEETELEEEFDEDE